MMKHKPLVAALALALGAASPHALALCRPDNTKPFLASPADNLTHGFANVVTDAEGVSLVICTDSNTRDGNPPPCFFDPVVAGNATSELSGFGGEGFYFLADNLLNTTGGAAISSRVVMATEAAYLSGVPAPGEQFSFTRLRIRVDVTQTGIYTVNHPWGSRQYVVDAVLDARGRPIAKEINETIDVEFRPDMTAKGSVGPWLRWDGPTPAGFEGYIGDGITPHTVTGSPCGQNFVRITATTLDGQPLAIDPTDQDRDGRTDGVSSTLFTVMGKLAPVQITPLAIDSAYYSRTAANTSVTVFASAPSAATVSATPGGQLVSGGDGYHFTSQSVTVVPTTVQVTAASPAPNAQPTTLTAPVTDLVSIGRAQAVCTIAAPRSCTLTVDATSSDAAATGAPTLTLTLNNAAMPGGTVSVSGLTVLPAAVSVKSSAGGSATKPLTVVNP